MSFTRKTLLPFCGGLGSVVKSMFACAAAGAFKNTDYGGFVAQANRLIHDKLALPANYTFQWSGEYELELRARQRLQLILPVVFFVILLSCCTSIFHSVAEVARAHLPDDLRR